MTQTHAPCWRCKLRKPVSEFYFSTADARGYQSTCIKCQREYGKELRRRKQKAGFCRCGRVPPPGYKTCSFCRERIQKWADSHKELRKSTGQKHRAGLRRQVFDRYGRVCVCCGIDVEGFLTIDHIEGNGNKHRKEIGGGNVFYAWLIRNGFPDEYRTLCYNCNCARGHLGYCPHERARLMNETSNTDATTGLSTLSSGEADSTLQAVVGPELAV